MTRMAENIAQALYAKNVGKRADLHPWEDQIPAVHAHYREMARAVLAVVRDEVIEIISSHNEYGDLAIYDALKD